MKAVALIGTVVVWMVAILCSTWLVLSGHSVMGLAVLLCGLCTSLVLP